MSRPRGGPDLRTLALLLAGGCWSSSPPPPEPVQNVAGPLEVEPVPEHSVWRGKYDCAQGITALELTLDVAASGTANALFVFGPHEQNPGIPAGSYRMSGTVREAGAKLVVRLEPVAWIEQPPSYVMVGLAAESDRARQRLVGKITNEGCRAVELHRLR